MQIILVQAEIEAAIRAYIAPFIASEGVSVSIDMSATRGTDGFKALIDIVPVGQEVLTDEPATLGIADKIAEAKAEDPAEAAPVRRTRRTAAQIAADNAAAAAGAEPVAEVAQEVISAEEAAGLAADAMDLNAPLAEIPAVEEASEDAVDQSQSVTNEEAAPAPRQSLFGNLNAVKNS